MPSQQQHAPAPVRLERDADLSIAEMTRIMDVAATLRRERTLAERELNLGDTKRVLRERLIEAAEVSGDPVTRAEIDAAIEHYFDKLHEFEAPEAGFETFLAHLYVMRNQLAVGAAALIGGAAAWFWVFGFAPARPRRGGWPPMVNRYTRGADVFRLLASADATVRAQIAERQRELRRVEESTRDDVRRRGEQLQELAEHYLPAVNQKTVGDAFGEVRGDLGDVLRRKQRRERELQRKWDTALDKRQERLTELDAVTADLDALVERREELEERLAEALEGDAPFQELSKRALFAEQELERNLRRVDESQQEARSKLPAYERSRLFRYLRDRGYGTPEYKTGGLTRRLDKWVARLVRYDKAKPSYDFLKITPELMAAEVDRRRDEFDRLMEQVEAIEQRHSDEIGLTGVLEEGVKTGKRRESLVTKIDAEQQTLDEVERETDRLAGSDNEFYREAIERMRKFLGGLEESALESATRGTASKTDDAIFAEVRWLNERLQEGRESAGDLRRQQNRLQRTHAELADIGRRFRAAEYDSQRSVFPEGFDPRPEVERLVRGEAGKEAVWDAIQKNQRFLPTWVERRYEDRRDLLDNEFSYLLMRVLAEAAGAAIRHAADSHRRKGGRPSSVRRRARGGFTRGRGF